MGASGLWTPVGTLRPKEGSDLTKDQPVTFEGDVKADAIPGIYPARMVTNHGCSEAGWLVVDDLPSVALAPESQDRAAAQLSLCHAVWKDRSIRCCHGSSALLWLRVSPSAWKCWLADWGQILIR